MSVMHVVTFKLMLLQFHIARRNAG